MDESRKTTWLKSDSFAQKYLVSKLGDVYYRSDIIVTRTQPFGAQ